MGTSITPTVLLRPNSGRATAEHPNPGVRVTRRNRVLRTATISEVAAAAAAAEDTANGVATWQIVVGSLAGVTPFVVAGIEFSKRIIAQRKCGVCKGSGLVLRDNKYYFRCPNCGGFLPWQSWKRFFSG